MKRKESQKGTTDGFGGIAVEVKHRANYPFRNSRNKRAYVTRENLQTGRENNGVYDSELRCVVYKREA